MIKKLLLLFLICIVSALNINAEVYEGSCGPNVRYSLDTSTGVLKVTGTGAMDDFEWKDDYLDYDTPWRPYKAYLKTVDITNGVTSVGKYAFHGCSNLTEVKISNSVTSIGKWAFHGCSALTSINIPDGVTSIGTETFRRCTNLATIVIPDNVTSIGGEAFFECSSLTSLSIGSGIETISNSFKKCPNLTEVYCNAKNVPNTSNRAFLDSQVGKATLYVPATSLEAYKATEPWSGFGSIVALPLANISINEINFPDANFRNYLLNQDYGNDGVLTNEEINGVLKLKVNGLDIENLKGIEFFTALTELRCENNSLTSLDVSKNLLLEGLDCHDNQITALDISTNKALTDLKCNGNKLTNLDVSNNTNLNELRCYENQLTTLIVTGCEKLDKIHCYSNQIKGTAMDVLIAGMPTISDGKIRVIYNVNEGNVMTAKQVATAKAKGWTPYYYDDTNYWQEYNGSGPDTLRGDANGDGKIDMNDVTFVVNIILGIETATEAADVNGDGTVNMPDAMYIVNKILNGKFPDEK